MKMNTHPRIAFPGGADTVRGFTDLSRVPSEVALARAWRRRPQVQNRDLNGLTLIDENSCKLTLDEMSFFSRRLSGGKPEAPRWEAPPPL